MASLFHKQYSERFVGRAVRGKNLGGIDLFDLSDPDQLEDFILGLLTEYSDLTQMDNDECMERLHLVAMALVFGKSKIFQIRYDNERKGGVLKKKETHDETILGLARVAAQSLSARIKSNA